MRTKPKGQQRAQNSSERSKVSEVKIVQSSAYVPEGIYEAIRHIESFDDESILQEYASKFLPNWGECLPNDPNQQHEPLPPFVGSRPQPVQLAYQVQKRKRHEMKRLRRRSSILSKWRHELIEGQREIVQMRILLVESWERIQYRGGTIYKMLATNTGETTTNQPMNFQLFNLSTSQLDTNHRSDAWDKTGSWTGLEGRLRKIPQETHKQSTEYMPCLGAIFVLLKITVQVFLQPVSFWLDTSQIFNCYQWEFFEPNLLV